MTGFNQFLIEEPSIKKKKMKKVAIFLGAIAVFVARIKPMGERPQF